MPANRNYRDSVFSALFSNPEILRRLYCALADCTLPPDTPITVNSLSDALFYERINDVSFDISGILVILCEHQATINNNMALRLLMYITRVYEKLVGDRNIYATKRLPLPRP